MSENRFIGFRDGQSTRAEVDALNKEFPALKPGDRITKEQIESIVGGGRLSTVIFAWRRSLMRKNVDLQCDRGTGAYYVPSPEQTADAAPSFFTSARRKLKALGRRVNAAAAHANEAQRVPLEHIARVADVSSRELGKQRMNLLPSSAANGTPQISPPKSQIK